ncbi:MAG: CBS domain-containing protein [Chloroflexi bacterium]|nr:CBS domain-containing protein [Chloroflexota bacterium]
MLVKDYMTRHPLMADPDMPAMEAQRYMGENNIRRLPVVGDGKRLLGLVTRQSLLVDPVKMGSLNMWDIAGYLSRLTVKDVMIKARDVVTIGQDVTIEEAARVMVEKKVGSLPVLEDGIVVGIITETDLLAQMMEMMATRICGVRATVRMANDKPGELAKLVAVIAAQGWGIRALGGSVFPKDPEKWDAVIKIEGITKEQLIAVLSRVEGQDIVDVREI